MEYTDLDPVFAIYDRRIRLACPEGASDSGAERSVAPEIRPHTPANAAGPGLTTCDGGQGISGLTLEDSLKARVTGT